MVNDFWIGVFSGLANQLGIAPAATMALISYFFAVGVAIGLAGIVRSKCGDQCADSTSLVGVAGFFVALTLMSFVGMLDFIFVVFPVVILSAFIFYTKKDGN